MKQTTVHLGRAMYPSCSLQKSAQCKLSHWRYALWFTFLALFCQICQPSWKPVEPNQKLVLTIQTTKCLLSGGIILTSHVTNSHFSFPNEITLSQALSTDGHTHTHTHTHTRTHTHTHTRTHTHTHTHTHTYLHTHIFSDSTNLCEIGIAYLLWVNLICIERLLHSTYVCVFVWMCIYVSVKNRSFVVLIETRECVSDRGTNPKHVLSFSMTVCLAPALHTLCVDSK